MELEIRSLKGLKFTNDKGTVWTICSNGHALYVAGKGYLSFKGLNVKDFGVKLPYSPSKKGLQSIIDDGGLIHYDNVEWLQPAD